MAFEIVCQSGGRTIALITLLGDRFQQDPIQITPETMSQLPHRGLPSLRNPRSGRNVERSRQQCTWTLRRFLRNLPQEPRKRIFAGFIRPLAGQKLVEEHTEGVDIGPCIEILGPFERFRAHIRWRTNQQFSGLERQIGQGPIERFGDSEVDYLGYRSAIDFGHQKVGGFEITMNDLMTMSMLDAATDLDH